MTREAARIAAFVSPHGFGHAARSSAIMLEAARVGDVSFDIFTTAPRWFFEESLGSVFRYHEAVVDVGFRQHSALRVDVPATLEALRDFLPLDQPRVEALAGEVRAAGCSALLCDIAPLGVAVAEAAGVPSVLVENFSWGWLYEPYGTEEPELLRFGSELDAWSARATVHIQARPVCRPNEQFEAVDPISRPPRRSREEARGALSIPDGVPLVVVTMGGFEEDLGFLPALAELSDIHFFVTGAERTEAVANVHLFDNDTALYMPDVLKAADAVVAKLGYGMVSEVWREGLPFAHVTRPGFRETESLEAFVDQECSGFSLTAESFAEGRWIERLYELLAMPRHPHDGGGAGRVADLLLAAAR